VRKNALAWCTLNAINTPYETLPTQAVCNLSSQGNNQFIKPLTQTAPKVSQTAMAKKMGSDGL
jgi:hypothetical protein